MPAPSDCTLCPLHRYSTQVVNSIVIGDNPKLMCVGEGPGGYEDSQGQPFVGPTGAMLRQELMLRGINSYILANATRCYPGENKKEGEMHEGVSACRDYLLDDIRVYQPTVLLALGTYALESLGISDPIDTVQCHILEGPQGLPTVVSYHPAAFMRKPGGIYLFEEAVYKVALLLNGVRKGAQWHPQIMSRQEWQQKSPH